MTEAEKRQEQIDRINKRLNTKPEFVKLVNDYFNKPVVAVTINTTKKTNNENGR